jgi:hypothetical protein
MPKLPKQQLFARELNLFIRDHPYFKELQGTMTDLPEQDRIEYHIADPDGDYEELTIILDFKP